MVSKRMNKMWPLIATGLLLAGCAGMQPAAVNMHGGDPSSVGSSSTPFVPHGVLLAYGMSQETAPTSAGPHGHVHGEAMGTAMDGAESLEADGSDELLYSCPMDPDVVASLPGSCPKCGMTLQPIAASEVYVCPMHAHVMSSLPGECPECGMTLLKQEAQE